MPEICKKLTAFQDRGGTRGSPKQKDESPDNRAPKTGAQTNNGQQSQPYWQLFTTKFVHERTITLECSRNGV